MTCRAEALQGLVEVEGARNFTKKRKGCAPWGVPGPPDAQGSQEPNEKGKGKEACHRVSHERE